jgi:hypothetical protein
MTRGSAAASTSRARRRTPPLRGGASAFIGTAFVQDHAQSARTQRRQVADQLRLKVPKLAALIE